MKRVHTQLLIDAPPEIVWEILTDFSAYPQWNPFIREAAGEARKDALLHIKIFPEGGKPMSFRPKVLRAAPHEELRWIGRLWMPGIFDGEHLFQLRNEKGGTCFVHAENFRGILVPFLWRSMEAGIEAGFHAMNQALKDRAENWGGVTAGA